MYVRSHKFQMDRCTADSDEKCHMMGLGRGFVIVSVQGGWGGWPTGNGKNVNSSQAQLGQATCWAVA